MICRTGKASRRLLLPLLFSASVAAWSGTAAPPYRVGATVPPLGIVSVQSGHLVAEGRLMPYLHGINYEGPADRPWHMWDHGGFDIVRIDHDLNVMAAAGYNPVRIFVQRPLAHDVAAGDYAALDQVVHEAALRGLRLLITFNDDGATNLPQVTHIESLIAAHLAGNGAIFGYDLRNEPGLLDIAGAVYPAGTKGLSLLSLDLATAYHLAGRAPAVSSDSRAPAPGAADWTRQKGYRAARLLLGRFLARNPAYPIVAPSPLWTPFLAAANRTLAVYLQTQISAIRAVDKTHLVTVGYNSRFWSALPANSLLDIRSIHLYSPLDYADFRYDLRLFNILNNLQPSPLLLEEYGVSTNASSLEAAAVREMATALYLRTMGGAGDMKWMLNDDPVGADPYENHLGAIDVSGTPKPSYTASEATDHYLSSTLYPGGLALHPDPVTGSGFVFAARDALAIGGSTTYVDPAGRARYSPTMPGVLWIEWSTPGLVHITPTGSGLLTLRMPLLTGALPGSTSVLTPTGTITGTVGAAAPMTGTIGTTLTLTLRPGRAVTLAYRPGSSSPLSPIDGPAPNLGTGWYLVDDGHNVAPPFLSSWLALGGSIGAGTPITEQFAYRGLMTQYFDDLALRIVGHSLTTAPLGLIALGATKPRAHELPVGVLHVYDSTTGHNIHGLFLSYWRRHGGLAFWGHPLSEEIQRHGETVQYFTGAAFALLPAPHSAITLLPLGRQLWRSERRVYGL